MAAGENQLFKEMFPSRFAKNCRKIVTGRLQTGKEVKKVRQVSE
jgi:hypothetical protein